MRSAIKSGGPTQKVLSSITSAIGVRLLAICASHSRCASSAEERMIGLQPLVSSISAMFRPTASQWPWRTSTLCASISVEPIAFHWSAYFATVRSVFFSPEPPTRIGRRAWRGRGRSTRSWNW